MTREGAIGNLRHAIIWNDMPSKEALEMAIKALKHESLCDRLTREYISKVKYCDECFASTFCTVNGLRNSRVPQDYCIENVKKYFEDKASLTGAKSEAKE